MSLPIRNPLFRHLIECEAGWNDGLIFAISLLQHVYLEKIRVLTAGSWGVKAPLCLNNVAWNNRIWPRFYSVGLIEQQTSWLRRPKVRLVVWFQASTGGSTSWAFSCVGYVAWGLKISEPCRTLSVYWLASIYGSVWFHLKHSLLG